MIAPTPYNSTQLAKLRTEKQHSRLYLAVLNAPQVFACQINQTFTTHDMAAQFLYDNPVGSYENVLPGQTALIGTAAGQADVGICRVRKGLTDSVFYTGEISEIALADNLHVTVIDDFGLWARHLRVVNKAPQMDYDVAYTNQHSVCDPVPVLGSHAVAWLENGSATVAFNASNSWVLGSTISAYSWSVSPTAGITISGGNTAAPTVTITQPRTYRISCQVSAANGASFTGHRYIFAYDDANPAIGSFQLNSCIGDDDEGGWSFRVTTPNSTAIQSLRNGSLIILFERAMYGNQAGSVGTIAGRENIIATGWAAAESIILDTEQNSVSFDVRGAHWWLNRIKTFPVGLEMSSSTPSAWTQMQALTVDKALWHFLHWRTTATSVMDVILSGDTRYAKELSSVYSSIWESLEGLAHATILARPMVNHLGQLFVKIPYNLLPVASRSGIPNIMDILPGDRSRSMTLPRAKTPQVAQVDLSGVAVSANGASTAYFSLSNGHVPKRAGDVRPVQQLLLSGQAQSNELAGLVMADSNNPYPNLSIDLTANNRGFDITPPMTASISLAGYYSGKITPRHIEVDYDEHSGKVGVSVDFKATTTPELAVNGDIPVSSTSDFVITPPSVPPFPPPVSPPVPPTPPGEIPVSAIFVLGWNGLYVCRAPNVSPRVWESLNSYFDTFSGGNLVAQNLEKLRVDRYGGVVFLLNRLDNNIYASRSQVSGWQVFTQPLSMWVRGPDLIVEGSGALLDCMDVNPLTGMVVVSTTRSAEATATSNGNAYFWVGNYGTRLQAALGNAARNTIFNTKGMGSGDLTIDDGLWVYSHNNSLNGSSSTYIDTGGSWTTTKNAGTGSSVGRRRNFRLPQSRSSWLIQSNTDAGSIWKASDGANYTDSTFSIPVAISNGSADDGPTFNTDGSVVMFPGSVSPFPLARVSTDGGQTWVESGPVTADANYRLKYFSHVSGGVWIGASNKTVMVTYDAGGNWTDITGNLLTDFGYEATPGNPSTLTLTAKGIDFIY